MKFTPRLRTKVATTSVLLFLQRPRLPLLRRPGASDERVHRSLGRVRPLRDRPRGRLPRLHLRRRAGKQACAGKSMRRRWRLSIES